MKHGMQFTLLFIIVCFSGCIFQRVSSQTLSTDESHSTTPICNTPVSGIVCSTGTDGSIHISQIDVLIAPSSMVDSGFPSASLTEFEFPQLTVMSIRMQGVTKSASLCILDRMKTLFQLRRLTLDLDPTVITVPTDFMVDKPQLNIVTLNTPNLVNATSILKSPQMVSIEIYSNTMTDLMIDSSYYSPNLRTLRLKVNCSIPLHWEIMQSSFPALYIFYLSADICTSKIIVDVYAKVAYLSSTLPLQVTGDIRIQIHSPESVVQLVDSGNFIQPIADFTPFKKLTTLYILYLFKHNIIPYYYLSHNFDTIVSRSISSSSLLFKEKTLVPTCSLIFNQPNISTPKWATKISTFPSIPVPATLTMLDISNNLITGQPPSYLLDLNPSKLTLLISTNIGIVGTIPQSYCSLNYLNIQGTSITSIPDCFWCYPDSVLATDLSRPPNVQCDIRFDSFTVVSLHSFYNITGSNLGWGINLPNIQNEFVIPNKQLSFVLDLNNGMNQNITLTLQSQNYTFLVKEASVFLYSIKVISQSVYSVELNATFSRLNTLPDMMPKLFVGSVPCIILQVYTDKNVRCATVDSIANERNNLWANNSYSSSVVSFKRDTLVTSVTIEPQTYPPTNLIVQGYFGSSYSQSSFVAVRVGDGNPYFYCNITSFNSTVIECKFEKIPPSGQAYFVINIPNGFFGSDSLVSLPFPPTPNDDCESKTKNCYGHGKCVNGQCVCDPGYYDDCRLQTDPNIIVESNKTDPTFSYKDYSFSFRMVAIQELDVDDTILYHLETTKWNSSEQSYQDHSAITYQLVSHHNQSSSSSDTVNFLNTNVTSIFEFSNQSRTVQFGGDNIQLASGSIKISVNITNWPFQSVLSSLRVLFSTVINTNQFIVGCDDTMNEVEAFQRFSDGGSIQYLRVVKNNTQFFGRFLEYSVSDGRKTFSKTELLNVTKKDDIDSVAIIGIGLPQSRQAILDPDFSALIVNNQLYGECGESNNDHWKLIVGVVVGVVGGVCLATIIYFFVKSNRFYFIRKGNKEISMKQRHTES
ncbi:hypothetical protein DFA_01491 [Cavenderia fasciculata]|uniref:ComC supersandwich domain-containing protein n=1 Tax=Cavenderia fasciculata TaxID=261658 RepID=F4PT29_CACFS|nr:uncharacterized protein DFA_01491 [Cavenderia fasciculata]EGG21605.1 hypothetical protein DFA_01491 [Cavenderia fasciculata]|eukprot:XP_004359455.1 hypothetical protein DFA_01491 [Cavenderia fasciculata]